MARKKKNSTRDSWDDDDAREEADDQPKSDAYVGLLAISFLALLVGVVLLYVDFDELSQGSAPLPSVTTSDDGLSPSKAAPTGKS